MNINKILRQNRKKKIKNNKKLKLISIKYKKLK